MLYLNFLSKTTICKIDGISYYTKYFESHTKTLRRKGFIGLVLGIVGKGSKGGISVKENEIRKEIVDAAYKIHTSLYAALLESIYEAVMAQDFLFIIYIYL